MYVYFITFRSVTIAQRGEGILRKKGIPCQLLRTPRWMEEQGCGYCLAVKCRDLNAAIELLRKNGVPFRKAYRKTDGEALEEVAL